MSTPGQGREQPTVKVTQDDTSDPAFTGEVLHGRESHEYEGEGVGRKEAMIPPEAKEHEHDPAAEIPPHH
jgi:hypothetical protein